MSNERGSGRRLSFFLKLARGSARGRELPSNLPEDQDSPELPTNFSAPDYNDEIKDLTSQTPQFTDSNSIVTRGSRSTQATQSTAATSVSTVDSRQSSSTNKNKRHIIRVVDADSLENSLEADFSRPARPRADPPHQSFGVSQMAIPVDLPISPSPLRATSSRAFSNIDILSSLEQASTRLQNLTASTQFDNAPHVAVKLSQVLRDAAPSVYGGLGLLGDQPFPALTTIVQIILRFADTLLVDDQKRTIARTALLSAFSTFADSLEGADAFRGPRELRNFALGSAPALHERLVVRILENVGSTGLVETEGAYVAPVLRGLSPRISVATLCIGMPTGVSSRQRQAIDALQQEVRQIHVYGRHDYICLASGNAVTSQPAAPFRVPRDPNKPPIAVSVATKGPDRVSGTLGGFLYPIVSKGSDYAGDTYMLTAGHVYLKDQSAKGDFDEDVTLTPEIAIVPSPLLITLFRKALADERVHYSPSSLEYNAYSDAIKRLDDAPPHPVAEFTWGERAVVNGMLSDIAVARCFPGIQCRNTLGDDIDFSQYDPALILGNLDVTSVASAKSPKGFKVFKYGSTSKFTGGTASTARIVYWSGGRLQSSEFAVRSENCTMFASGGDSGAWILAKSMPFEGRGRGLSVVGMLHSYDGEFKEFGLYTHMQVILSRLEQVSGIPWGVVGVPSNRDLHDED